MPDHGGHTGDEWDTALRKALLRATSRRYPLYWTSRGGLNPLASNLVAHRGGTIVPVADADTFFVRTADAVAALAATFRPDPRSLAATLALGARYCRDGGSELEWSRLLSAELPELRRLAVDPDVTASKDDVARHVQAVIDRSEAVRRFFLIGARWGTDGAKDVLLRALSTLALRASSGGGLTTLITLRDLPALLCFYWALAGAVYGGDLVFARRLLTLAWPIGGSTKVDAATALAVTSFDDVDFRFMPTYARHRTPGSDLLFDLLRREATDAVVDASETEALFQRVELLVTVQTAHERLARMAAEESSWFFVPVGRYVWSDWSGAFELLGRLDAEAGESAEVRAGLMGGSAETSKAAVAAVTGFLRKHATSLRF